MLESVDLIAQTVNVPEQLSVYADGFDVNAITTWDLVTAGVALVGGFAISRVVRRAVRAFFERLPDAPEAAGALAGRIAGWGVILTGLIIAVDAIGFEFGPVLTILLIAGLISFLALRPLLENLGSGLLLQARGTFRVGDQIGTNDVEGTVYRINARAVIITTQDGRHVHVPNSDVIGSPMTNFTTVGRRRTNLDLGVALETDLDHVRELILRTVAGSEGVLVDPEPEAYVHEFAASSITIRVRFWHEPEFRAVWVVRDRVARALKSELTRAGIELPFPQQTIWLAGRTDATLSTSEPLPS